jgi:hypothetical protein
MTTRKKSVIYKVTICLFEGTTPTTDTGTSLRSYIEQKRRENSQRAPNSTGTTAAQKQQPATSEIRSRFSLRERRTNSSNLDAFRNRFSQVYDFANKYSNSEFGTINEEKRKSSYFASATNRGVSGGSLDDNKLETSSSGSSSSSSSSRPVTMMANLNSRVVTGDASRRPTAGVFRAAGVSGAGVRHHHSMLLNAKKLSRSVDTGLASVPNPIINPANLINHNHHHRNRNGTFKISSAGNSETELPHSISYLIVYY